MSRCYCQRCGAGGAAPMAWNAEFAGFVCDDCDFIIEIGKSEKEER